MSKCTMYLNNSGSRFTTIPKEKVLVFHGAEWYCKKRTIEYYEMLGNFAVACLKYNGKRIKAFLEDCNGTRVFFVDHTEKR